VISGLTSGSTLHFWFWRHVESYSSGAYDQTHVQVSYNGGSTWTTVWTRDSRNASEQTWTEVQVPLSPGSATSMQVRFFFDSRDGISNNFPGWLIDDVRVTNP
jgi:hypothetical protein